MLTASYMAGEIDLPVDQWQSLGCKQIADRVLNCGILEWEFDSDLVDVKVGYFYGNIAEDHPLYQVKKMLGCVPWAWLDVEVLVEEGYYEKPYDLDLEEGEEYDEEEHGEWIEDEYENRIIDPMRWTLELVGPYIYDDEGGSGWRDYRTALIVAGQREWRPRTRYPVQTPAPGTRMIDLWKKIGDETVCRCLAAVAGVGLETLDMSAFLTIDQVVWLANVPHQALGGAAEPFYKALTSNGLGEFIPIDDRAAVLKEDVK